MLNLTSISLLYACILFAGAYFGGRAGSRISVISGGVSGLLIIIGAVWAAFFPDAAKVFLICIAVILEAVFVVRVVASRKIMPAGGLLLLNSFYLFCVYG